MSKYTTGEIAKLCNVSVRTVQYYDSRKLLIPSELSEGGRRLYSEEDVKRLQVICFLRDAGIGINSIGELLSEKHPEKVISVMLEQQEQTLKEELDDRQAKLDRIEEMKKQLKYMKHFSVEAIGDIAYHMENKKKMRQLHAMMLLTGIPLEFAEWGAIAIWIGMGIWWPFVTVVLLILLYGVWVSQFYFKRVVYICPQCHEIFRPALKEAFFAKHTPTLRKVTCTGCGHKGFCVETYGKEIK